MVNFWTLQANNFSIANPGDGYVVCNELRRELRFDNRAVGIIEGEWVCQKCNCPSNVINLLSLYLITRQR